jgi:hypothetical protein
MILTSKQEIPWTPEEPQTNAKNAYVCATRLTPWQPGREGSRLALCNKEQLST